MKKYHWFWYDWGEKEWQVVAVIIYVAIIALAFLLVKGSMDLVIKISESSRNNPVYHH